MQIFNINGTVVPPDQLYFKATSRGYRYGDGFFESMKWSNGRVLHYDLHLARIHKSAMLLQLNLPEGINENLLEHWISDTADQAGISNARIRCTIFREAEGYYVPENSTVTIVTEISEIAESSYEWNEKGLLLGAYKELTKNANFTSALKTTSSLIYVLAGIYARENGFDECIIFNDQGRIAECISCNLFAVNGEFISTPPLSEYCVDGVMRKVVMQLAEAYGYTVIEQPLSEITLISADEIFITNASRGIRWIGEFQGKKFTNHVAKVLSEKLQPSESR